MINTRLSKVGLSRQSAGEGTPIASPATFGFGLLDGRVIELPIEQSAEEVTSDSRVNPGHNRTSA
ncbi:MAG: hypothetical protein ACRD02_13000, partial [Acidimicrobiia bacterium]